MKENKEYFAFISYKSEDVEWAIWLQYELEHNHLPTSYNGRTDIRQELRPMSRDIDELILLLYVHHKRQHLHG